MNVTTFQQQNGNILQTGILAVNQKYNESAEGYQFSSIVSVNEQIVAGINYALTLDFTNAYGENQYYEVVIYDCPWNPSNNQVVSVQPIAGPVGESFVVGGWSPVRTSMAHIYFSPPR